MWESDGSMVSRREFENELGSIAAWKLANFLGSISTVGLYYIVLDNTIQGERTCLDEANTASCIISEPYITDWLL